DFIRSFGFSEFDVYVSTRPKEKYVGELEMWEEATNSLKSALKKLQIEYSIDEGGGVFYGPKIDIKIRDALNRLWQCTTIQFDFNLSERFKMEYIDSNGLKQRPYMIHRAIMGSLERFVGVLIEHTVGDFPVWLAPIQAVVIPITENQNKVAKDFFKTLIVKGIRAELNDKSDTVGAKIREAELKKIPYMYILGEREYKNNTVSVRRRKVGDKGVYTWVEAVKLVDEEIKIKGEI
ncbi:MAG: threonine--tRNA ligase, partial [Candidatus Marinimicrobia bacterium]|nr:threonine--tRNA ligase [Candidatus Neomarinimicrobiota bacterium]